VVVQPKNQDIDAGVVGNPNKSASAVPDALIVASLVAKEASTMLATDGRCRVGQLLKGNVTQKDYCSSSLAIQQREKNRRDVGSAIPAGEREAEREAPMKSRLFFVATKARDSDQPRCR